MSVSFLGTERGKSRAVRDLGALPTKLSCLASSSLAHWRQCGWFRMLPKAFQRDSQNSNSVFPSAASRSFPFPGGQPGWPFQCFSHLSHKHSQHPVPYLRCYPSLTPTSTPSFQPSPRPEVPHPLWTSGFLSSLLAQLLVMFCCCCCCAYLPLDDKTSKHIQLSFHI